MKELAPKLAGLNWTVRSTAGGGYVFSAAGTIAVTTSAGARNTAVGITATVTRGSDGKAVVWVLAGTGTEATVVR